ncbi:MAG: MotA/TolQ/ExbB proton channel family protein [Bdellovibrionota bacterium]
MYMILVDYYLIDIGIVGMGIISIGLILERAKVLFFDYHINSTAFTDQVMKLVSQNKIEESIAFCSANIKKPIAQAMKIILERADRSDEEIGKAVDRVASEIVPTLEKRLGYLPMVSNVVTLIGLLGTVAGLIMSFKAVSFADPTQKQTLLADGISVAMNATALGLMVAIPVMVAYAFLNIRQGKLFSDIDVATQRLCDFLRSRGVTEMNEANAYPTNLGNGTALHTPPPAPAKKVS